MQGFERPEPGLWDISAVAGHLLPEGGMFAFLARNRAVVFPDAEYADLFAPPGFGRPSVPATRMAAVMTLQVLHDYSDRETAEAVRYDLRWKLAAGLPLEDGGFDPSTLVYWRRRLAKSARPDRINDAVKKVAEQTGILKGRRRRVADSTILANAVASQYAVTELIAALRRVARVVPGAAEVIAAQCTGHDYGQPRRPVIDWGDRSAVEDLVSRPGRARGHGSGGVQGRGAGRGGGRGAGAAALVAVQGVEPVERERPAPTGGADRRRDRGGPDGLPGRPGRAACAEEPAHPHRRLPRAPGRGAGDRDHHR